MQMVKFYSVFLESLIKNILNSGCAYYPIDITCFSSENLSWSVGKEYAKERFNLVKALSRGWSSYVTMSANLPSRIDYFEPIVDHSEMREKTLAAYKNI